MNNSNGDHPTRTVHLDLTEYGFEGEWADLRNPWFMAQKQFNAMIEKSKEEPQHFLREMIAACSIKDSDGNALTDPMSADFETIPAGAVKMIGEKLQELFGQTVPKTSATT